MISIVVPTYCEADNITPLLKKIGQVMSEADLDWEVLVADDRSPDHIVDVIENLAEDLPVRLLQSYGRARDLSLSVMDGIREAGSDRIVVMDADLSHPPEMIPAMVERLDEDESSFVIGSRYTGGGSFDRRWSLWRFLNSFVATWLARPLTRASDPMSGFFAFNRRHVELGDLRPVGYKIGLELMVRGNFSSVSEVPIRFRDRTRGESKMNLAQQMKYLRHLRRLYLYRFGGWAEFVHYGAVGASGFLVDVVFYYLFQFAGLEHHVARALSFWPAVSWNWALNRITTFGERRRRPRARQWVEFVLTSLLGFTINWGIYMLLTGRTEFFDTYRILALLAGIGCASFFNFTVSTLYVYSEKRDHPG